jgi:hypothetical protein
VIPSIGRIVLFAFYQDRARTVLVERPAIVTSVTDGNVINATVFFELADGIHPRDPLIEVIGPNNSDAPVAGRWRWPPRV